MLSYNRLNFYYQPEFLETAAGNLSIFSSIILFLILDQARDPMILDQEQESTAEFRHPSGDSFPALRAPGKSLLYSISKGKQVSRDPANTSVVPRLPGLSWVDKKRTNRLRRRKRPKE